MQKIQMVDLHGQYKKIQNQVLTSIEEVIEKSAFINGEQVQLFERKMAKFVGSSHCIACANGTDALQIAMMALDLKPGDEIIMPTFTYIASVETAVLLGLVPVLCDVDGENFNINVNLIESLITPRTRAILAVHLFGQSCDMEAIMELANKHGLFVIEDNAQSIGSMFKFKNTTQKMTGTIGHIGTTSFFPSKNLGCYGDGGALFTQDDTIGKKIRMICNHGQEQKYYHDIVGVNSRLDTIQASILNVKIEYLPEYIASRQLAASRYDLLLDTINSIKLPKRFANSSHVFHQYSLLVIDNRRDELRSYLSASNIPTMVYYPLPVHKQKGYLHLNVKNEKYSVADKLCDSVLSLPMHTELTEEQIVYITDKIREFFL